MQAIATRSSPVRRRLAPALLVLAALLVTLGGTSRAAAADFPVINTNDAGAGSLRAAIEAANNTPGPDAIPISAEGEIGLNSALPKFEGSVDITGPGSDRLTVLRTSSGSFRIFTLEFEAPLGLEFASISGLTIAKGRAPEGGGILDKIERLTLTDVVLAENEASNDAPQAGVVKAAGGGLAARGKLLTLRGVRITRNRAVASPGTVLTSAVGGGLVVANPEDGQTIIEASTIAANRVLSVGSGGEAEAFGAGIALENVPSSKVTISRSTVADNSLTAMGGVTLSFGASGISGGQNLTILGSTISGNRLEGLAGPGENISSNSLRLGDTIIAGHAPGGANCAGLPPVSLGFNISDDASCGLSQASDLPSRDPGIAPQLGANGGPTPTFALLPGSVAIDRGSAFGASADQRGEPRPSDFLSVPNLAGGDGSDVGAFELQAPASPPPAPAPAADRTAPNTRIGHGPRQQTRLRLTVFRFSSTEAGSRFECKLDRAKFRPCRSPFRRSVTAAARRGARHVFLVRAIDGAGNVDSTPARYIWRVRLAG